MIVTSSKRVTDRDEGDGIEYKIVDTDLVHVQTKHGGLTPTKWPVVPLGFPTDPGCEVWSATVYFRMKDQGIHAGRAGGPAFIAMAREQERIARDRSWLDVVNT